MKGLNHPDLATKAGEEPLPQSDDSNVDDLMDLEGINKQPDENEPVYDKNSDLIRLAVNALPLDERMS